MVLVDSVLVVLAGAVLYVAWTLLKDPRRLLRNFFGVHELGLYEAGLPNLERAVIVAHKIEDPQDSLREAVRKNIGRGVKYLFMVSNSRYKEEKELGYKLFTVIADMVLRNAENGVSVEELVDIKPLPYEWIDTPYIFYELREEERRGVRRVIALRGNEHKEGIAEGYMKVEAAYARTIYRSLVLANLRGAHLAEIVDDVTYGDDTNVVKLETRIMQHGSKS